MTVRTALLVALALVAAMAPAGAAPTPTPALPAGSVSADCLATADAPPCGYIVPQIALEFPDKPPCRAKTLGGPIELADCLPLPAVGSQAVQQGIMRFSWDITQDGTYPPDPSCVAPGTPCIVISFTGTATNPKWMALTIEPPEVVVEATDFVAPENLRLSGENQDQVIFMLEVPLTVTFKRTGLGDDDASQKRIERAQGASQVFLKAKSSANGQYYREAFGVEEFRFNPCANDDGLRAVIAQCGGEPLADGTVPPQGKDAPGFGVLGAFGALAAVAVALRRRRA